VVKVAVDFLANIKKGDSVKFAEKALNLRNPVSTFSRVVNLINSLTAKTVKPISIPMGNKRVRLKE